jgi:predicted permease
MKYIHLTLHFQIQEKRTDTAFMPFSPARLAARKLARDPGLLLTVSLTLALGIGATAAALAVADGVVLSHMPYRDPGRLIAIVSRFPEVAEEEGATSYPDFEDLRRRSRLVAEMAAVSGPTPLTLTGGARAERVSGNFVSAAYFHVLGARAVLGRTFLPGEDRAAGADAVAVMSHDFWARRFGSDRGVVGRTVVLDDIPYVVVGVLPPSFHDFSVAGETDLWLPVTMASTVYGPELLSTRRGRWLLSVGRLAPGAAVGQARTELRTVAGRLAHDYPESNAGIGVTVRGLDDFLLRFNNLSRAVGILTLAAGLVLLVAMVNVVGLLSVRATTRSTEVAIRQALGARRSTLVRQFVGEALLLTLPGGAIGILLAAWGTRSLRVLAPIALPAFMHIELDARVVAVTLALTCGLGLLLGWVVARSLAAQSAAAALRLGQRGANGGPGPRLRHLLMTCESACVVVLLVGASLLAGNLRALRATALGFHTGGLLSCRLELGHRYAADSSRRLLYQRLEAAAQDLPGVGAAALWGPGQPGNSWWFIEILPEGRDPTRPQSRLRVFRHSITPAALSVLGITVVHGRGLLSSDGEDRPLVAVVSQTLARRLWGDQEPLGRRFRRPSFPQEPWITVVGVAADVRQRGRQPENLNPVDVYLALRQFPVPAITLLVRSREPLELLVPAVRRGVGDIDPNLPLFDVTTVDQSLAQETAEPRFYAWLLGVFAGSAALLAGVGLYGVIAYSIGQRRHEIALRMALGARRRAIFALVARGVAATVLAGAVVGLLGARYLALRMAALLHGAGGTAAAYAAAVVALALVAFLASAWPVRRAVRTDPAETLRSD